MSPRILAWSSLSTLVIAFPILILAFPILGTSCFDPRYEEGILCSRQDTCPGSLVCDTRDRICRSEPLPACVRDEDCPGLCDLDTYTCVVGECGDGVVETAAGEVCEPVLDGCCNDTCDGPVAAGISCRASASECDASEVCDGVSTACPGDAAMPDGSACDDCAAGSGLCEACAAGVCTDLCGNGAIDGAVGEQCEPTDDAACPGFCVSACACAYPANCLAYVMANPQGLPDGSYTIDPDGPGGQPPFSVECDMSTDGGGFTRLVFWDRESDPGAHTLASFTAQFIDEVAEASDPDVSPMGSVVEQASNIRWSDADATFDALAYRRDVLVPNTGDVRVDVHYNGWSMERSAVWLYAVAGGAAVDMFCWSDVEVEANYTAAEKALIPYPCPLGVPDGTTFTWDTDEVRSMGAPVQTLHLRSLHGDANADFSYLYGLSLWVR